MFRILLILFKIVLYRVKYYVENGFDKKYFRDFDNGVNIMKKKVDFCLFDKKEF